MNLVQATALAKYYATDIAIKQAAVIKEHHNSYSVAAHKLCVSYQQKENPEKIVEVFQGWSFDTLSVELIPIYFTKEEYEYLLSLKINMKNIISLESIDEYEKSKENFTF